MADSAPKRKRRFRKRYIALFILAVFALAIVYAVYWAYTVEANPKVDYAAQLEQLSRDAQSPGENGWPLFEQALAKLDELEAAIPVDERPNFHQKSFNFDVAYLPLKEEDFDKYVESGADDTQQIRSTARAAVRWLEENGAFDLMGQALDKPNVVRPTAKIANEKRAAGGVQSLMSLHFKDQRKARVLAQARAASLALALEVDDTLEALIALEEILTLGGTYFKQPSMTDQLFGLAIIVFARGQVNFAVQRYDLDNETLKQFLHVVRKAAPRSATALAIEGERLVAHDMLQRSYSDGGLRGGTLLYADVDANLTGGSPSDELDITNLAGLYYPGRRAMTAELEQSFENLRRLPELTGTAIEDAVNAERQRIFSLGMRYTYLFAMTMPAADGAVKHGPMIDMVTRGMELLLLIEMYERRNGEYPDVLSDALTDDELSRLADPYSGKPFIYRKFDQPDKYGRDYVLYSVGSDGVDNGGYPETPALRQSRKDDVDHTINLPITEAR